MLMAFILLDESGDLGFSKGSSKFFTITIIFTKNKRKLEKIAKNIHKNLSKKYKRVGALHAYNEQPVTRQRLLKQFNETDCSVLAIILNKQKVYTRLQDEKAVLYNYVANILLDRLMTKKLIPINEEILLIASQRETNRFLNDNFKNYLSTQIKHNHAIDIKIKLATPHEQKALQIVDFASWALHRNHSIADDSYYNLFKSRIIEEIKLF